MEVATPISPPEQATLESSSAVPANRDTTPVACTATTSKKRNIIFDLPQEFEDEVFKLAYPRVANVKLVTKNELAKREVENNY